MGSDLEERVRAMFRDKLQLMKMPEKEDDFLPPACRLLEKQRELDEVEKSLVAEKVQFQVKMEELQQQQQELERKEGQFKEAILKFDKFLKENDAKRKRALRKASEEQQQTVQRGTEAELRQQEIAQLQRTKEKLQQRLAAHKAFPEYLQKVLEKSEQFQEIPELIDRFQTLMSTQANLAQRELVARKALEEERARLQQYIEESSNRILQENNQVAELQSQLDQIRTRVLEGESNWICIQNTAANKTLELGQIKLATVNLFQTVAKLRGVLADVPMDDTEAQLDVIQQCTADLAEILADFRKGEATYVPPPQLVAGSRSEPEPSYVSSRNLGSNRTIPSQKT